MKFARITSITANVLITCLFFSACSTLSHNDANSTKQIKLNRVFPTDTYPSIKFDASIIASTLLDLSHQQPRIIVPVSNGIIAALDAKTGDLLWKEKVPTPKDEEAQLIATPIIVDNKLVVSYQCLNQGIRTSHRLAVLDLLKNQWDKQFPVLSFNAEKPSFNGKGIVKFNSATAFSHAALKHWNPPNSKLGYVYAAFGNASDIQPFHGWLFEVDLDRWQHLGVSKAIRNILLTTPETDCPKKTEYGTQEMICGGGIWVPGGPLIEVAGNDMEIFIPTGNGQVNLEHHDFSNMLLRVKPGLQFDAGCNKELCQKFDPLQPNLTCIASCKNIFIPRLGSNDEPIKPPYHECDNKDFWECLAWMDYDLGANVPIKISLRDGHQVIVQAGKDGGVYLIDANHLGTQYDRLQIAKLCGSKTDLCKLSWAGMIVTQPVQSTIDNEPIVVIPTFNADKTNASGLVALKIVLKDGQPKLQRFWNFPNADNPEALQMFRSHPSFPLLTKESSNNDAIIWIVDIATNGTLYGIRVKDGSVFARQQLLGSGRQLSMPLMIDDTLYIQSVIPSTGKAMIEAYQIISKE